MDDSVKIILVDDHEIFRKGLKVVLNKLKYAKVIAEAANGEDFLKLLKDNSPDIILMDIQMPKMNGIDATTAALKINPDLNIIALTMFNENDYIQSMIDAGVKGFLMKNINKETLDKAIQTVVNGGSYYSEELFDFFTRQITREEKPATIDVKLTKREKEILQLVCEGLSNKEIAEILYVSERTVVGHKSNLFAKLDCKNTISLMFKAIKSKLVVV